MADRLRAVARGLKKATVRAISDSHKSKIQELKLNAADKLLLRRDDITKRIKDAISQYEKFTGVQEVMQLQNNVVSAQERFIAAQDKRRELGRALADLENRLKEVHAEMHTTMKGEEKYLHLCTEEHKLILQERSLRQQFSEAEREEREKFAEMSAAVKLGHERERAHAERNKYWYIVASILGTVLGIAGSTINNHLKMAEFRELMGRRERRRHRQRSPHGVRASGESRTQSEDNAGNCRYAGQQTVLVDRTHEPSRTQHRRAAQRTQEADSGCLKCQLLIRSRDSQGAGDGAPRPGREPPPGLGAAQEPDRPGAGSGDHGGGSHHLPRADSGRRARQGRVTCRAMCSRSSL